MRGGAKDGPGALIHGAASRRNRILVALGLLIAFAGAPAQAQKRVALVMGNQAYVNAPPLANPVDDANAVAAKLEALGFEVHLALNVTQDQALDHVDRFAAALTGAEAALFFYSGHGMQIEVQASSERSVRYGSVDIAEIVRDMEENAEVSIVVLDACRDNPFLEQLARTTGGTRSVAASRGLAVIKPTGSGTIIAYAAAAGNVASDG